MKRGFLKFQSRFWLQILLLAGSFSMLVSSCGNRSEGTGKQGTGDTLQNPYKPSPPVDKYGARPADFKPADTSKYPC